MTSPAAEAVPLGETGLTPPAPEQQLPLETSVSSGARTSALLQTWPVQMLQSWRRASVKGEITPKVLLRHVGPRHKLLQLETVRGLVLHPFPDHWFLNREGVDNQKFSFEHKQLAATTVGVHPSLKTNKQTKHKVACANILPVLSNSWTDDVQWKVFIL